MEALWAPWRLDYVKDAKPVSECVFCVAPTRDDALDREHGVIGYGEHGYVILNRYPYTNGHVLVVPFAHESEIDQLDEAVQADLHRLLMRAVRMIKAAYGCPGLNIGLNMGSAAGAGIASHLHYHVVPRWPGDTNFMPVVGGAKVIPESLEAVYDRLKAAWSEHG
ncbi:MAG: HIT domain-containing protein [Myxococcota bacterium]|nr:HIT domain-containing protein [Myxococcota bacterium]